ncbi:hypothetical protein NMB32_17935 [Stenotrophomonas sp. CD2]|nr:hypothetical protein NMB32_17935 [Stenotrophomonas sp. CD2]
MDGTTLIRGLAASLGFTLLAIVTSASASGARQGVKPQPGEIVLLRDVSARPAYRMAPPGMALIADPKPQREIAAALGAGGPAIGMDELSDEDYAGMGAGRASPGRTGGTTVERVTQQALGSTLDAAATAWSAAASAAP